MKVKDNLAEMLANRLAGTQIQPFCSHYQIAGFHQPNPGGIADGSQGVEDPWIAPETEEVRARRARSLRPQDQSYESSIASEGLKTFTPLAPAPTTFQPLTNAGLKARINLAQVVVPQERRPGLGFVTDKVQGVPKMGTTRRLSPPKRDQMVTT